MKIEVYNLNKILKVADRCPGCNILSIRDSYSSFPEDNEKYACLDRRIKRNGINALVVRFDDIDPYRFKNGMEHPVIKVKFEDGTRQPVFFTKEIASDIMGWMMDIWKNDHNANVKIHCWAGHSRSQAVAYWLNMYFNLLLERNLEDYMANNALNIHDKVHFNCEVLRVLSTTFG